MHLMSNLYYGMVNHNKFVLANTKLCRPIFATGISMSTKFNAQNFSTMLHKKLVHEVNALIAIVHRKFCDWEGELIHKPPLS
jgi:hypothetical protein